MNINEIKYIQKIIILITIVAIVLFGLSYLKISWLISWIAFMFFGFVIIIDIIFVMYSIVCFIGNSLFRKELMTLLLISITDILLMCFLFVFFIG